MTPESRAGERNELRYSVAQNKVSLFSADTKTKETGIGSVTKRAWFILIDHI